MKIEEYVYNGYKATVIIPDEPNGKWIWKTEFLYAFDQAEVALVERGYIRVNYEISDKYGSYGAAGMYVLMDCKNRISVTIGLNILDWPSVFYGEHLEIVKRIYGEILG